MIRGLRFVLYDGGYKFLGLIAGGWEWETCIAPYYKHGVPQSYVHIWTHFVLKKVDTSFSFLTKQELSLELPMQLIGTRFSMHVVCTCMNVSTRTQYNTPSCSAWQFTVARCVDGQRAIIDSWRTWIYQWLLAMMTKWNIQVQSPLPLHAMWRRRRVRNRLGNIFKAMLLGDIWSTSAGSMPTKVPPWDTSQKCCPLWPKSYCGDTSFYGWHHAIAMTSCHGARLPI